MSAATNHSIHDSKFIVRWASVPIQGNALMSRGIDECILGATDGEE